MSEDGRSNRVSLAAANGLNPEADEWKSILVLHSSCIAHRTVEAVSQMGLPFDLRLKWTTETTLGNQAQVTLSRSGRICVFARTLEVEAANLSGTENQVAAAVYDAQTDSQNVWEWRADYDGLGTALSVPVPDMARSAHISVATRSMNSDTEVTVLDAFLQPRGQTTLQFMPPNGIPVGSARVITVLPPAAVRVRVLFTMAL